MPATVLDGTAASRALLEKVAAGVASIQVARGVAPSLASVMAGDDPAARWYTRAIGRAARRAGIGFREIDLPGDVDSSTLAAMLHTLNQDETLHGVIVQFPLPGHLRAEVVTDTLDPAKDIDGITPASAGRLMLGQNALVPSTPQGGMMLLAHYGLDVRGLDATIVGRSNIVGKPLALLLIQARATVTVCHTATRDLAGACRRADVLCAAAGQPGMITVDMVKPGAIVLDFGTSPGPDDSIAGDVDFGPVSEVAGWITPVKGGTGAMTTAVLLHNTLKAARSQLGLG